MSKQFKSSKGSKQSNPRGARGGSERSSRGPERGSDRAARGPEKAARGSGFAPGSRHGKQEEPLPRHWRAIIGHHAIREALEIRPQQVKVLWMKQGYESSSDLRDIMALAQEKRVKVELQPEGRIDKFGPSHQGAALYVDGAPKLDFGGLDNFSNSTVILLDGIEDPHNLGAILRTSWLTGVHGIIIPEDRAVGLTPTVHKVACGGAEHVPVLETTNFTNPVEELKKQGYWVFGLSHKAKRTLFDLELPAKVVWAIGAEDKGLRVTTERMCDELVSIPQASAGASYNASVATAIALTETMRQHAHCGNRKKSP